MQWLYVDQIKNRHMPYKEAFQQAMAIWQAYAPAHVSVGPEGLCHEGVLQHVFCS